MNKHRRLVQIAVCTLAPVLIAHLGLRWKRGVADLIRATAPSWMEPLTKEETVQTLWMAAVGVHAAVAALAPVLGYTLLATNVSNASKIAPAGPVVAEEIGWASYLERSLALLAGCLIALVSAPSLLGLAAAIAATAFVLLDTGRVFTKGFDLLERPEEFDRCARSYLKKAIAHVPLQPQIPNEIRNDLAAENTSYQKVARHDRRSGGHNQFLYLGAVTGATQVVAIRPRAIEKLASEAEKLGLELRRVQDAIPEHIGRHRLRMFSVVWPASYVDASEAVPKSAATYGSIEPAHIYRLQELLEGSLTFGPTPWTQDMARLPLIAKRHVASLLHESIPAEQPYDFEYGLEVLSEVIDEVEVRNRDQPAFGLDVFDWVHEIPSFLASQIFNAPHSAPLYARYLAKFLRGRLVLWLSIPQMEQHARWYAYRLTALLKGFMPIDMDAAGYMALMIREVPILVPASTSDASIIVQRELIMLFVDASFADQKWHAQRRLVLKTIRDTAKFGQEEGKLTLTAETIVVSLAMALSRAHEDPRFAVHVKELVEGVLQDQYEELPFEQLLDVVRHLPCVNSRWGLTWWELADKEEGEAHWLGMDVWLLRATITAISHEAWKLDFLDDGDIPGEDILQQVSRHLTEDAKWIDLLPQPQARLVRDLLPRVAKILARRKELIALKVATSPVDIEKIRRYVTDVSSDIRQALERHNRWFKNAGVTVSIDEVADVGSVGSNRLVPREWFVPDGVADVHIHTLAPRIGSAVVDFEVGKIAKVLSDNAEGIVVASPLDEKVWAAATSVLSRGSKVLIVGVGVSERDVSPELEKLRELADSDQDRISYRTLRLSGNKRSVIVASMPESFRIIRRMPRIESAAIYEERIDLEDGGVISGIVEIDESMTTAWLSKTDEDERNNAIAQYQQSLLDRNVWNFEVEVLSREAYTVYVVEPAEQAYADKKETFG